MTRHPSTHFRIAHCDDCNTCTVVRWYGSRCYGQATVDLYACWPCTLARFGRRGPRWRADTWAAFVAATAVLRPVPTFDEAAVDRMLRPVLAAMEAM